MARLNYHALTVEEIDHLIAYDERILRESQSPDRRRRAEARLTILRAIRGDSRHEDPQGQE